VTRSWAVLLGDEAPGEGAEEQEEERTGRLRRLRSGLAKSRRAIAGGLTGWRYDPSDLESWEALEDVLISADVGVATTQEVIERLESRRPKTNDDVVEGLGEVLAELASPEQTPRLRLDARPAVVLVVGVNGTGKTTTIGKLASRLAERGRSVIVAAADTYRAAADEQLEIWASRAGADFVGSTRGGDPAAVAFDAIAAAEARDRDVVIVDTAGRLHTQTNLMEELAKIRRVIAGRLDGAPHETLLVLDATTGQNGLRQAKLFGEAVEVTGVVLTKLDGTAKGGIVVAIGHELGLPVKLVGVGEGLDDLQPFDAADFARALVTDSDGAE
jgi:fused signal recognition particle receptor